MLLSAAAVPARAEPAVSVCIDPEPPPWSYWKRDKDGKPTKELTGFSVEVVQRVFRALGRQVRFRTDEPWQRCVHDISQHKTGFVMDLYKEGSRVKELVFSIPYDTLTPQIFTRRDHPIEVKSAADLKRYKGCGVVGGAYAHYGLDKDELDISANGYAGAVQKLKSGYCDYFVEELEILAGFQLGHENFLSDPEIAHHPLTWVPRPSMHLATSPESPDAALMPKIDAEIEHLGKTGELAALWRKYAGDIPYNR